MAAVKLAAYETPSLLQANGKGKYDKVFEMLNGYFDRNWRYPVLNAEEIEKRFEAKEVDCIIPFDIDFYEGNHEVKQSDYINLAKVYIFTKPEFGLLAGVESLKGKRVAARRGMPYGAEVAAARLEIHWGDTIQANIMKLLNGRVDAMIAYVPDAWFAFKYLKMEPLLYDAENPLVIHEDAFLCHDTEQTEIFIKQFNRGIKFLKQKGAIKWTLDKAYIAP